MCQGFLGEKRMNNKEYIEYLTKQIKSNEQEVYEIYCQLRRKEGKDSYLSEQSMRCTIGSKNNIFTDCVKNEFLSPSEFIADWIKGLCDQYGDKFYYGPNGSVRYILIEMMKYPICKEYIYDFLTRNFYRNINERKRYKPSEQLWEVWFGSNPLFWGIMISPAYRNNKWTNDVSEIRRASYEYWTIGHILSTGIVVPNNSIPYTFSNLRGFITFYNHIIMRLSKSDYEKGIMERYFKYLNSCVNVNSIPLLIPEFRFENDDTRHKYRLDFTILNPYTRQMIGFEISPQSTHMSVTGIRKESKSQQQINNDIKTQWEKEMTKRNEFFSQYGITVVTFTDSDLVDLDKCFKIIQEYLEMRNPKKATLATQEERLNTILSRI